ncbi:MAG: Co2+/Mg2+ efflux protein ApaG [Bradymonadales bacterium]|nr:MAG: Co2+/Mg2+ efflux protein ApaG [Bradymonadales bacterium]
MTNSFRPKLPDFSQQKPAVETTQGIRVEVRSQYFPPESKPESNLFYFVYEVQIFNESETVVQLLRRHWVIRDALGQVEEVKGDGVVGQQPVLAPDQVFRYVSACPLWTPRGEMHGHYVMANEAGEEFLAKIPKFRLGKGSHLRLVKAEA